MEPHVTVVWFVLPQWFQEMGAFLKEENIAIAVDWAETAFKLFGAIPFVPPLHTVKAWLGRRS